MNIKTEWKKLAWMVGLFLLFFWLPVGRERFINGIIESLQLSRWYAREHVLLCLVPAFFIAGAIGVFISQAAVMKYLGARANKILAYGVASVSGSILAVCSCTVLPLFAGMYFATLTEVPILQGLIGAGMGKGPALALLLAGPALSLPNMLVIRSVMGTKKTVVFCSLVVVMATISGIIFGAIWG